MLWYSIKHLPCHPCYRHAIVALNSLFISIPCKGWLTIIGAINATIPTSIHTESSWHPVQDHGLPAAAQLNRVATAKHCLVHLRAFLEVNSYIHKNAPNP